MLQNLFLANPCCSREPWFENCTYGATLIDKDKTKKQTETKHKVQEMKDWEAHTWGKHIGIPPRIAFGGLKIAYITKNNIIQESRHLKVDTTIYNLSSFLSLV